MRLFTIRDNTDTMPNAGSIEVQIIQEKDYPTTRFSRSLENVVESIVRNVGHFRASAVMLNRPQFFDVCFTNADNVLVGKLAFTFIHNGDDNTTIHVIKTRLDIKAKPIVNVPVVEAVYCADENNILNMISEVMGIYRVN